MLFFIELSTRKVEIAGIASAAAGLWMSQIGRNLTGAADGILNSKRYLIHDRDPLFTTAFGEVFMAEELRIITTFPRTPRMNAICERVIGTLRRELLDRTLILG